MNPNNNIRTKEVININNIFFEDSFIELINSLSKIIKEYYFKSNTLIKSSKELTIFYETNILNLMSLSENSEIDIYTIIDNMNIIKDKLNIIIKSSNDNLSLFFEKAKEVFKEMNKKKNIGVENIYNDYARKHSLKNEEILRKSSHKLGNDNQSNLSNKKITKERNKTINKSNTHHKNKNSINNINNNNQIKQNINIPLINKLLKQLGEFNEIIKKHSINDGEIFNKIQKQIFAEVNKSFNKNTSKSVERNNQLKGNTMEEKNPFIMVNNNSNNITMTTTNNNSYYNIIDTENLKEINPIAFQNIYNSEDKLNNNNDINIKNKKNNLENNEDNSFKNNKKVDYEKIIKKLNEELSKKNTEIEMSKLKYEEMEKLKDEFELKFKAINNKNTSLSKCLVDKNREIQRLQNNNKINSNELTKLKLIVKNNEKQLKVKKLKADQQKEKNTANIQIKDLLGNKRNSLEKNEVDKNSPNISKDNLVDKEEKEKLEIEIGKLKEEINLNNEKMENLVSNINKLELDNNEKKIKNDLLNEELLSKDIKIKEDDIIINNLKNEKDKFINKLKDYKNLQDSYQLQINSLKVQIKEMIRQQKDDSDSNTNINKKCDIKKELKKLNNELVVENLNLRNQLEFELNYNKQLKIEVKSKDEQIGGLNQFINKLMLEKEKNSLKNNLKENINNSKARINTDSGYKGLEKEEKSNKKNKTENIENKADKGLKIYTSFELEKNKKEGEDNNKTK